MMNPHHDDLPSPPPPPRRPHQAVVLFYRYFTELEEVEEDSSFDVEQLQSFCQDLCDRLGLRGRILLATEGINGTVSAIDRVTLNAFITAMEEYYYYEEKEEEEEERPMTTTNGSSGHLRKRRRPFYPIDWKISSTTTTTTTTNGGGGRNDDDDDDDDDVPNGTTANSRIEPFPDLKIRIVSEIISTGGSVSVRDLATHGGTHLSPQQFHEAVTQHGDQTILIDVRNTFEHDIGHFVHPATQTPALNPATLTFSSFEDTFCHTVVDTLRHKKVLLYCTGGIRCEKASVMLRRLGVDDVSQLQGGIHRYLERYGDTGYFRGKNFVFDQRVAQTPAEVYYDYYGHHQVPDDVTAGNNNNTTTITLSSSAPPKLLHNNDPTTTTTNAAAAAAVVVGRCLECDKAFDELCGSRLCTVCRDLVLICPTCETALREYHCRKHLAWRHAYYTFLEPYGTAALQQQFHDLERFRAALTPNREKSSSTTRGGGSRNVRRTLTKQMEKVKLRLAALESGTVSPDPFAPKRCRTCLESRTRCDGRCWGFWKQVQPPRQQQHHVNVVESSSSSSGGGGSRPSHDDESVVVVVRPIAVGDTVEPGPDWNELRFGSKYAVRSVVATSTTSSSSSAATADDDHGQPAKNQLRRGTVVRLKTWAAGSTENDCAVVSWDDDNDNDDNNDYHHVVSREQIYRWGVPTLDGRRVYELTVVVNVEKEDAMHQ